MGRKLAVVAVMVGMMALLFAAGCRNYKARQQVMQQARDHQVTLTRDGDSPSGGSAPGQGDSLRGKTAPGFTLVDLNGKKVSLADFKGHPVVVNFWATWCGPCKLEMPWFQEFSGKYKDQGLQVLGLSQDDGASPEEVGAAAKKIGVTYPILMPDSKTAKAYGGVDYLPETFYVDRNGNVVAEGAGAPSKAEMEANIRKIVGAM